MTAQNRDTGPYITGNMAQTIFFLYAPVVALRLSTDIFCRFYVKCDNIVNIYKTMAPTNKFLYTIIKVLLQCFCWLLKVIFK